MDEPALVIDIAGFEGPLDLLLHLARNQKVDLSRISVLALAEQYLTFVETARRVRIELAADYLVMAAWLAFLKSKLLIPQYGKEDGPSGEEILKSCEKQGFVGLAYYDSGARSMFTAKKPVRSFADMKGLKVRVQQSDLWVSMLEAMGANATPMPMGEVYTGLKTGLIDAAENNYPTYESARAFEVAKYYSKTEHSMAPEILLFSKRTFDKLSPEEQRWVRQAAKESVPYMRKQWAEREAKSLEVVKAGGAEIIEVDKAPFQAAMRPVYDKFITDAKLKDLVKRAQDTP